MIHQINHVMKSFALLAICLLACVCEANADPIQIVAFGTVNHVEKIISQLRARNIQVLLLIRAENQKKLEKRTTWFREIIAKYDILFLPIEQPPESLLSDR